MCGGGQLGGDFHGVGWDCLNGSSLALAGTSGDPIVITVLPLNLADFTETAKTITIATSSAAITGFAANALAIHAGAMPGTGTWSAQLDPTSKQLQLVYTLAVVTRTAYADWTSVKGLTENNKAAELDPDHDGGNNLAEFAFNGDPLGGSNKGCFFTGRKDTGVDPDAMPELVFTCAVRRGAVFVANGSHAEVSAAIDGVIYTVEAATDPGGPWNSVVSEVGSSDTPPAGSGLPDLTGTAWQYRIFSAFNGLVDKGFIRAVATSSP